MRTGVKTRTAKVRLWIRSRWTSYSPLVAGVVVGTLVATGGAVVAAQRGPSGSPAVGAAELSPTVAPSVMQVAISPSGAPSLPSFRPGPTITKTVTVRVPGPTVTRTLTAPTPSPAAQGPERLSVSGNLVLDDFIDNQANPEPGCEADKSSLRVEVKDGSGTTVALATLGTGVLSDLEHGDGYTAWTCTYRYSAGFPASSAVYTFKAYYEDFDKIKPMQKIVTASEVASSKAPDLSLYNCILVGSLCSGR